MIELTDKVSKLTNNNLSRVWNGVDTLLDDYASLSSSDFVLLIYTSDALESAVWVSSGLEQRAIPYCRICTSPLVDTQFEDELSCALPSSNDVKGRLVVFTFERNTMSHTEVLNRVLSQFPSNKRLVYRTISASRELFETALLSKPELLESLNTTLLEQFMPAHKLRIKTKGGTDITVCLDSHRHRWISNRGIAREGGTVILPAGEVATYPVSVDGTFVADFAFNVNTVTEKDVRLVQCPVHLTLKNGELQSFSCVNPEIYSFLEKCLSSPCTVRVGELGFGTNISVHEPIAFNSHVNERCPGIHLGFGQHNQGPGVVDYQCEIHLDLIAQGGQVWVDDSDTPIDLKKIVPSDKKHPYSTRDEDVFSPEVLVIDSGCCGSDSTLCSNSVNHV